METIEKTIETNFIPLEAVHPTDLIIDELKARGMKRKELAERLGMKAPNLSRFISTKENVTPSMALKLEQALGISAAFWMDLQLNYERNLEAIRQRDEEESKATQVEAALAVALNLPILFKKLSLDGFMFLSDRLKALYEMFNVTCVEEFLALSTAQGCFKKSEKLETENKNLSTWILLARHACLTSKERLSDYKKGNETLAASLIATGANAQNLTENEIKAILAQNGIGYCVVEKFEKTPVDAYSVMIGEHPFIVVSHRKNNMDMLVFDILHECGHINKHLTKNVSIVSYNQSLSEASGIEHEANNFAMDMLIPPDVWAEIVNKGSHSLNIYSVIKVVTHEAEKHGISPTIAAWRFKYETGVYQIPGFKSRPIR
ncbi:MAG: HigA family addiction module antidote protein [Muribaculaceae bacterium]|nr:HigA family addiction module antidote protein [Muribaculaceae bacterium]